MPNISAGKPPKDTAPARGRAEYRFRNELSEALTVVVVADSEDLAREELARIGLHPSFFQLVDE